MHERTISRHEVSEQLSNALILAAENNLHHVVKLLLENGAKGKLTAMKFAKLHNLPKVRNEIYKFILSRKKEKK